MARYAKKERSAVACNIPMFLNVIVFVYVYLTFMLLGDGAIDAAERGHAGTTSGNEMWHSFVKLRTSRPALSVAPTTTTPPPSGPAPRRPMDNAYVFWLGWMLPGVWNSVMAPLSDLAICAVLAFFTLRALHIAALSDPGEIPLSYQAPEGHRHDPGAEAAEAAKLSGGVGVTCNPRGPRYRPPRVGNPYYCYDCSHERPLRAHHCRYCTMCIARFDHHCDWIDNCVGVRNHKCFVLFIAYIFGAIVHFALMFTRLFATKAISTTPSAFVVVNLVVMVLYVFIVLPCGILALFFLCNTLYQLVRNETTIEASYPSRHKRDGPQWQLTWYQAVQSVMGGNPLLWWWPELRPLVIEGHVVPGVDAPPPKRGSPELV